MRFEGHGASVLHVIQAGWLAAALLFISAARGKRGKTFRQHHGKVAEMKVLLHTLTVREGLLVECISPGGG